MNEEELREAVSQKLQAWVQSEFHEKSQIMSAFGSPDWRERYDRFLRESGIRWDETLNILGVRRVEHHLRRPPRDGHIRIGDPFAIGPNGRRDLEMTQEQAEKILVLGIP